MASLRLKYSFYAFLEGVLVMSVELLGAKMISPYYGTTLFVWTIVLGITLTGLALGYFLGGCFTEKLPSSPGRKTNDAILFYILGCSALLIALMPKISLPVFELFNQLDVRKATFFSSILIILIPLVTIATLTPFIIQIGAARTEDAGKVSGEVYAISTMGGILTVFLLGFLIIPRYGINDPLRAIALGTALIALLGLIKRKKIITGALLIFLVLTISSISSGKKIKSVAKLLYQDEGILGQISVLDVTDVREKITERRLFINNISQSMAMVGYEHLSLLPYVHQIATLSSVKPKGSEVLQIGYGGGHIASEMIRLGFKTDVVELDKRIIETAGKYFFNCKDQCTFYVDDARHYIRTARKKYDIIILDISTGETQSSHNFTIESFRDIQKLMKDSALFIINYQGYLNKERGIAARSIYKSLLHSGFNVRYVNKHINQFGDIIFLSSFQSLDNFKLKAERVNDCCKIGIGFSPDPFNHEPVYIQDAIVLTDNKPKLEYLNILTSEEIRERSISEFIEKQRKVGIPVFK